MNSEPYSFSVKPYSPETVPRPASVEILQAISKVSGGQFYEGLDALNSALSTLKLTATEEKSADYRTLWRELPVQAPGSPAPPRTDDASKATDRFVTPVARGDRTGTVAGPWRSGRGSDR